MAKLQKDESKKGAAMAEETEEGRWRQWMTPVKSVDCMVMITVTTKKEILLVTAMTVR